MSETNKQTEKMYDKEFWTKFIQDHGNKFEPEEGKLLYLYSEDFDLEEELTEMKIYTDNVLELKMKYDEEGSSGYDFTYVLMSTINSFRYVVQT